MLESTSLSTSPFQSTLPLRGATSATNLWHHACMISIHAPPAGSDCFGVSGLALFVYFNPRSPCGERRGTRAVRHRFQDFNPRSPCGERPVRECALSVVVLFQSTLPLRGATPRPIITPTSSRFQSTLPLRGATKPSRRGLYEEGISIHAPLAGSDDSGESARRIIGFQSTLPLRGATNIQFHLHWVSRNFNPRSPCGERLGDEVVARTGHVISIHAPLAGSD